MSEVLIGYFCAVNEVRAPLAGMAPLALLGVKHLNRIARDRLERGALAHDVAQADASDDLREGSRACAEKRAPRFRGQ